MKANWKGERISSGMSFDIARCGITEYRRTKRRYAWNCFENLYAERLKVRRRASNGDFPSDSSLHSSGGSRDQMNCLSFVWDLRVWLDRRLRWNRMSVVVITSFTSLSRPSGTGPVGQAMAGPTLATNVCLLLRRSCAYPRFHIIHKLYESHVYTLHIIHKLYERLGQGRTNQ